MSLLTESSRPPAWKRLGRSLSAKLILLLLAAMLVVFGVLGYLNIRLHRRHLEQATLLSAERVSDVLKRSTSYYMMRNDREGLYHIIGTIAQEPGMERVRIFNKEGRISFSTDVSEVNQYVDKRAEACYACHTQAQPLTRLDRPDRFRIYRAADHRVLGIINPIENQPACSNAACHAHPAEQKILGVLDTNLSLARADASLAEGTRQMLLYTVFAVAGVLVLIGLFVWEVVHRPVKVLRAGTDRLARGDLGYQIDIRSHDELGELASSFNRMSRDLREARSELTAWTRTLEERVQQKTSELKAAHEQMLQAEKLASLGKLAAVVAHEINNPLSGILTYARLLRRWAERGEDGESKREEIRASLELIESESRRCGDIVRNLLSFARTGPMNLVWADLNTIVDRCLRLVKHQLELNSIQLHTDLAPELPRVPCDSAQVEQMLLALVMNAIDAMPRGGNLRLRTRLLPESGQVQLQVADDGLGIPPELLPRMFEPFVTTKEERHGVGLGLAISRNIVERHQGSIHVESEPGKGTTFTVVLPLGAENPAAASAAAAIVR
ncbi:MAG TPA: ATP-binding protein [Terriglobales bacterium]|nr:ATP-binding protein [Terriglobales bacterium]